MALYHQTNDGPVEVKHHQIKGQPQPTKYIIREDNTTHDKKLVFADQSLYLTGPVNYTVVGSPTIVDGIASGFSTSDYLTVSGTVSTVTSFEVVIGFETASTLPADATLIRNNNAGFALSVNNTILGGVFANSNSEYYYPTVENVLSVNSKYYAKLAYANNKVFIGISSDGVNYSGNWSGDVGSALSFIGAVIGWKGYDATSLFNGSIDLNSTYIKVNDTLWFYGKNYATSNIAPVPSGFQLNNTATPQIGYIDMRTQQFTAAPEGATIGRDE